MAAKFRLDLEDETWCLYDGELIDGELPDRTTYRNALDQGRAVKTPVLPNNALFEPSHPMIYVAQE
jgi:hypothetical protein